MRPIRRAAVNGLFALWLAPLPALAGSQSSDTSTNCSNGHCTRIERLTVEDRYGRRGWVRDQHWIEPGERRWRHERPRDGWGYRPRRERDDD